MEIKRQQMHNVFYLILFKKFLLSSATPRDIPSLQLIIKIKVDP